MNSIWLSLLWKEWCEFRWKLLALTASFVLGQTILMMAYFLDHPSQEGTSILVVTTSFCLITYGVLAGAFIGMSVAAGENSHRTMRFTQALPIPTWQAGFARILIASMTVILPILAVVSNVWLFILYFWDNPQNFNELAILQIGNQRFPWGISNYLVGCTVASSLGVTSLLVWVAACGVNRGDEVRAGAIAFLICSLLWGSILYGTDQNILGLRDLLETISVAMPGGPAFSANFGYRPFDKSVPLLVTIMVVGHGVILGFFLLRYGQPIAPRQSSGKQFLSDWFCLKSCQHPLRSQTSAIIWKQVREVAPLALLAIVGILLFLGLAYISDRRGSNWRPSDWGSILGGTTMAVCVFVTIVSGIAVIYEDYSRGVSNFWRSRPINLHQWFFLKFATGILVLVLTFGPLMLVANWLMNWSGDLEQSVMIALWLLMIYTVSLAAFTLVRQPIYSVVITVALFAALPLLSFLFDGLLRTMGIRDDQVIFIVGFTMVVIATVLAWQAVVRNWGWKQHR